MTKSTTLNTAIAFFAAIALTLAFVPSFASADGNVTVVNNSAAKVVNVTSATADSGGNSANGGRGNNGGNGGDIYNGSNDNDQDVDDSSTGNGGNGGNGGSGGVVDTGDATAVATTKNVVNNNNVVVNRCACNGEEDGDDTVRNRSRAHLFNVTGAGADTGNNKTNGNGGGNGGDGGDIENYDGDEQDVDDSTTGSGGHGGHGGHGGVVWTGSSISIAATVNVVNRNLVRIRR